MKHFLLILSLCLAVNLVSAQDFNKLYTLGNSYAQKGNYQKAISNYTKAEKYAAKKTDQNRVYKALAENYRKISDYVHAIDYYEKLLTIYNDEDKKRVLLNLSDLWILTGQYKKVIDNLENMDGCPDETVRLTNLSAAYCRIKNENKALKLLDDVLTNKNSPNYKIALQNKGYIYWQMHKNKEAEDLLTNAVMLYDFREEGKYLCMGNLAMVKSENGKYDDALKYINSVIEWQETHLGKKNQDYIISIRKKAEILKAGNCTGDAAKYFKDFFLLEKEYVVENFAYMTENERLNFWHSIKPHIDKCYSVGNIDADFLFDVAVFSKNVLTLANINFHNVMADDADYEFLLALKAQLFNADYGRRSFIENQIEMLEKQLIAKYKDLDDFRKKLNLSGRDIRNALPKDTDAAIEFVCYPLDGNLNYAALVSTKNKVDFVPMFTAKEINNFELETGGSLKKCMDLLINGREMENNSKFIYSDTLLSKTIWEKITSKIANNADVYFVPDGIFYKLAIEYLCFERNDLKLHRLSSMSVLTEKRNNANFDSFLLIGSLVYNNAKQAKPNQNIMPNRAGSVNLTRNIGELGFLKNSLPEIYIARNKIQANDTKFLMRIYAVEDVVKNTLPKYSNILISTHGYNYSSTDYKTPPHLCDAVFADSSMTLCGLALSGAMVLSNQDSVYRYYEDGLLTAYEISQLNLQNVDLVVMAACQTNLGAITSDGVFNLPRGFKKAGVNTIVATLWSISDEGTKPFVTEFYKQLKLGKNKYDALASAQNHLKNQKNINSPYFWAPFVLIDGLN